MLNEQQQKALDLVSAACAQRPLPENVRTRTQLRPRYWFLVTAPPACSVQAPEKGSHCLLCRRSEGTHSNARTLGPCPDCLVVASEPASVPQFKAEHSCPRSQPLPSTLSLKSRP